MEHHEDNLLGTKHDQEHAVRCAKLEKLAQRGRKPWGPYVPITHTCKQAKDTPLQPGEKSETEFIIGGRMVSKREHGKSAFAVIQDRSDALQLYLKKDVIGDENFEDFLHLIDLGDYLHVKGHLFITKTGEKTLDVAQWQLLSKSLHPLPEKFHGLSNIEQKYRQRYLDLISNRETLTKFLRRSTILQGIRKFLTDHDFVEVETPMLHPIPGGAAARPFVTHHNAYKADFYLRIAPELYLKRLVIGGIERVFEINRNFRNEGVSTRHNPEFTMLEFYMAHGDYHNGMRLTEQLIGDVLMQSCGTTKIVFGEKNLDFTPPFACYAMDESLIKIGGLTAQEISRENIDATIKKHNVEVANATASYGEKIAACFEELVEEKLIQPTFIINYPIEISPLAQRDFNNPEFAARFELFAAHMEIANGFTELNDPFDQAERFKQQGAARESGDSEAHHYDADYIQALEYGLPPTVGVGIGIDRLVMLATNTQSIKDVILFPTLKHKQEE